MFHYLNETGCPCDAQGQFLPPNTPPTPRNHGRSVPDGWDPFDSRLEFELAEFLYKTEQMSGKNISKLMELWAADVARYGGQPPFADQSDLYSTIDAIVLGDVPWSCLKGRYQGARPEGISPAWMDEEYEVWFRNPRELVLRMLANPDFKEEFDVAPYRDFTRLGSRRYRDFMSGNWAWREAVSSYMFVTLSYAHAIPGHYCSYRPRHRRCNARTHPARE